MSRLDGWLLVAWLALAGAGAGQGDAAPDPAWQEPISRAVSSVARQDDDAAARVETLRELGRGRRETLLVQLALFLERAEGTEQTMAGALVLRELSFTPREKLDAILPHLDRAGPDLRRVFTELLSTIDRPEGGAPDFQLYEETIRARKDSSPGALIRSMYEVSPLRALVSLERIYGPHTGRRTAQPAEVTTLHVLISRPVTPTADDLRKGCDALEALSRDPAWWTRLYAAAVARVAPRLATPEISARLTHDPHVLVREMAGATGP